MSTGEAIGARVFQLPRSRFEVTLLTAEIGAVTKGRPPEELHAAEITNHFITRFRGQVTWEPTKLKLSHACVQIRL